MIIRTEPTTTPEVPAWLNLEAFNFQTDNGETFQSEVTGLIDYIDERIDDITYIARRIAELTDRFESAVVRGSEVGDDVFDALQNATGMGDLDARARRIEAMFEGATNGTAPEAIQ